MAGSECMVCQPCDATPAEPMDTVGSKSYTVLGSSKTDGSKHFDFKGASLGTLQGLCCPMGAMGIAFLASLPPVGIAVFTVIFFLVSVVGTGAVSSLWLRFASRTADSNAISSRTLYRLSCAFTVVLGVAWIVANYFDVLDKLNYAEGGSAK